MIIQKRTACDRDCPDACGIVATIENGRVTRLRGDADHPVTRGFLCHRTSRFLERQYAQDRLTAPLVRRGDDFHPITWEEGLDHIAAEMLRFREESGSASILHHRCGGSMGILKQLSDYFFECFGPVTTKSGDICSGAGEAAQEQDFGHCDSNDLFDLKNSRTIILWGKNVFVSSVHLIPHLKEAKKQGAHLVLIDPIHHRTASLCDLYLQPRPGGDAALACGVSRWLFENDQIDPQAANYCDHFAAYHELVHRRTLGQWAAIAGVSSAELGQLAEMYSQGPSAILVGWGLQRRRYGAATVRTIDALATVAGNVGIRGGGVSFYFQRRGAFDYSFSHPEAAPRRIPEPLLGPGILAQRDPPIRMVWITAANPVAMLPESKTVAHALRTRELTVVVDSFLTDTARCADYILPTTTMLEEDDLLGAYGHHWLTAMTAVTEPPEGVKSDYEILQELAKRVGLNELFSDDIATWQRRVLKRLEGQGIDLQQLIQGPVRNPFADAVVFADRVFATPSGRVNLIHELPDELVTRDANGSTRLAAISTEQAQGSQWMSEQQQGPATATVHPQAAPGLSDGDRVRLVSSEGSLDVLLQFDEHQRPDMVLMQKGGWFHEGRCANELIKAELTDAGECAVYYDTAVRVERIES